MIDDFAYMLNMGDFSAFEREEMERNKVDFKKVMGKVLKESRAAAKTEKCYYCGEKITSFCNSHSVPAFCLRNIKEEGKVATTNTLIDFPLLDTEKGINQAGTFHIICQNCDNKIFADYENPHNYENRPTDKMLAQIALKNNLHAISKRLLENEMYECMCDKLHGPENIKEAKQYVNNLDLKEYIDGFNKAKKCIQKNLTNEYYLCYYEKLNYTVPIAFQDCISLVVGFDNEVINNVYNTSPTYKIKPIHIGIFPLKESSVIIMFIDNGDKRYRRFYKKFNSLTLEDRLQTLTYIMFAYSENVFFSKTISEEAKKNYNLVSASQQGQDIFAVTQFFNAIDMAKKNFTLDNRNNIPNLLSEQYKLNIK